MSLWLTRSGPCLITLCLLRPRGMWLILCHFHTRIYHPYWLMAAKQHFNNFMIVGSGTRRAREGEMEKYGGCLRREVQSLRKCSSQMKCFTAVRGEQTEAWLCTVWTSTWIFVLLFKYFIHMCNEFLTLIIITFTSPLESNKLATNLTKYTNSEEWLMAKVRVC